MSARCLEILSAGPMVTVQDQGRPGFQRDGVAEGGAVDRFAFAEGAALLGNPAEAAALEFFAFGGSFRVQGGPIRLALSGAPFRASLDGVPLSWRSSFLLKPGQELRVEAALEGNLGYLAVGGGVDCLPVLGARSTHLRAAIGGWQGRSLKAGDRLPLGEDNGRGTGLGLPEPGYLPKPGKEVTEIRILWGAQAHLFSEEARGSFLAREFRVSNRLDRMGVRLESDEAPLPAAVGLTALSDGVSLGDVQVPGDGVPMVLLVDRQPTGGYPRIATVITADLAKLCQLAPGRRLRFVAVVESEALSALASWRQSLAALPSLAAPLVRRPEEIPDLLSYNLISGVVAGQNRLTTKESLEEDL